MQQPLSERSGEFVEFWTERHLVVLSTVRADGTVHAVPVGATLEPETGIARVICSRGSHKARQILKAGEAAVAVTQVDGRKWSTLEGRAVVSDDPERVAEAVRRYAERYRQPRVNPERVVIEITVTKVLGNA
ncbi:TIGR03618 family F420-dependent PPOX class oxidoreductase [Kribbella qitaiheensis]|uniref:TIGR03618 family F420-dependent PPOX class oxidoreductase n=1 Tax=Kribbella qitaiheensis TaxID=1544730 RepID=A0A7G6WVB9_9ACTN|nr:TIGR03618 family F420-dependent PPOX class oxidoreductase [Kribbella qitaiheensis]QNE17934.1 TIGR03618 family F420-dependent PPOX class oxidoreductase [Kribbella qitaiheensis]